MRLKVVRYLKVTGLIAIIILLNTTLPVYTRAHSELSRYDTEDYLFGSTTLEERALALLESVLREADNTGDPFPPDSEVVQVRIIGEEITIDMRLPADFLDNQFDAQKSDEIVRIIVNTLIPLGMKNFHVRVENEAGEFLSISDFLPPVSIVPPKLAEDLDPLPAKPGSIPKKYSAPPIPGQGQPQGALSGKVVWLSAGHGWEWRNDAWRTQRPNTYGIVEDFSNAEAVNYYLARYLWNAGAEVWLVRERGMNENEIIVDNDDGYPSYVETGDFTGSEFNGYNGGGYRYAVTNISGVTASASWSPVIPEAGWYPVWVWYRHSLNRSVDARYEIHHSGGSTTVSISQEVHGMTWRFLGEYYFEAGTSGHVTLVDESSDPEQAIIADAVRFGGGMGSINPGGGISGEPRWEEASIYYAAYQGFPVVSSINDVIVRPLYAEWEHASGYPEEDAVYVSWHTNCCNYSGTMSFIHNTEPTPGSSTLRSWVHDELIQNLRGEWDPDWLDQGKLSADFGELRELTKMPGVLLEVAFHDSETPGDADDLKEPYFRQIAARAIYQGIAKYFAAKDGSSLRLLPAPPTHLSVRNTAPGEVTIHWKAPEGGGEILGDLASKYKVYQSKNGRGFDNGIESINTYLTLEGLQPGSVHFFRVTALNEGGESFPTPVVAVRVPEDGEDVPFLLVDGFDRLDKQAMISQDEGGDLGAPKRMFLERMNRYDYAIEHAKVLQACSLSFDGALNESVVDLQIPLADYAALDWFIGEDSIKDEALSGVERSLLKDFLDGGGNLIISGSDIGYELASPEHGVDKDFYNNYLKAVYAGSDASTHTFTGVEGDIYSGLSGIFDDSSQGYYDVDSPDMFTATGGSRIVLNYDENANIGAALAYSGQFRVFYYGFPLETAVEETVRNQLICKAANTLLASTNEVQYLPLVSSSSQ